MNERDAFKRLTAVTRRLPTGPHVLDAGCGFQLPIPLDAVTVTGIDISPAALARNERANEKILGDITTYPLPRSEYDAVVCWDVLEHLRNPRAALRNLAPTLKPGGLLIVGLPELFSAKGLLTKAMPHQMKVWYFRRVMRTPDAGKPGGAPFRTFLRITPRGVVREGERLGMETVLFVIYNSGAGEALRARSWAARAVWWLVSALLRVAGRDPEASDAIIVLAR